jgi:hypothetical protein
MINQGVSWLGAIYSKAIGGTTFPKRRYRQAESDSTAVQWSILCRTFCRFLEHAAADPRCAEQHRQLVGPHRTIPVALQWVLGFPNVDTEQRGRRDEGNDSNDTS